MTESTSNGRITREQVFAAADRICAEKQGGDPTQVEVRVLLGTGSMGTIHKYLRQWREQRPPKAQSRPNVPPAVEKALMDALETTRAAVAADLQVRLVQAAEDAEVLASAVEKSDEQNAELRAELDKARIDGEDLKEAR